MRLFPARALIVWRDDDTNRLYTQGRRPFVTLVSVRRSLAAVSLAELRALGYRRIARDPSLPSTYYVRPLPLWALLKATDAIRRVYWRTVSWLYRHGVFHLASEESADFRWRDVHPGPGR